MRILNPLPEDVSGLIAHIRPLRDKGIGQITRLFWWRCRVTRHETNLSINLAFAASISADERKV